VTRVWYLCQFTSRIFSGFDEWISRQRCAIVLVAASDGENKKRRNIMTTQNAKMLQTQIAKEAVALMVIHGKSVSEASSEEEFSVAHYEEVINLIGQAWSLPAEVTTENLNLIQREKDAIRRIAAGEDAPHILPERELPMSATGMETLDNVRGLFETSIRLDSGEQRMAVFKLANQLADCHDLLGWIKLTPAETELP